jgi:hypothetical protein
MIALAILGWVSVSLLGTVTLVEQRNRKNHRWAVAHMAAHHQLSVLEASSDINTPAQLVDQDGIDFTIEDASYVVEEGIDTAPKIVGGVGRVFIYDLSMMPVAEGGWDHAAADQVYLIRVSIDVNEDGNLALDKPLGEIKPLDSVDDEDVNVFSVRVF